MTTKRPRKAPTTSRSNEPQFYETMPMSMGSHHVYRDDIEPADVLASQAVDYDATAKRFAIITLLVVAALAIGVGILIAGGMSALRDSMPVGTNSIGL